MENAKTADRIWRVIISGLLLLALALLCSFQGYSPPVTVQPSRVGSDIALSTSATNLASWSLGSTAQSYAWQCMFLWTVTAGTTPTLAVGVNASQVPASATNVFAELVTSNAGAATENTVTLSASGATSILTSPTLTPAATIFSGSASGVVNWPATAGTFAITLTGTGASFAGAAKAGSTCVLY